MPDDEKTQLSTGLADQPETSGPDSDDGKTPKSFGGSLRTILLDKTGFVAGRNRIAVYNITRQAAARQKVVIEGLSLNVYDRVCLIVDNKQFSPVEFHKAYKDSESISFLIPNFSNLTDGQTIPIQLFSTSNPAASGTIRPYLVYKTKKEEQANGGQGASVKAEETGGAKVTGAAGSSAVGPTGAVMGATETMVDAIIKTFTPKKVLRNQNKNSLINALKSGDKKSIQEFIEQAKDLGDSAGLEEVLKLGTVKKQFKIDKDDLATIREAIGKANGERFSPKEANFTEPAEVWGRGSDDDYDDSENLPEEENLNEQSEISAEGIIQSNNVVGEYIDKNPGLIADSSVRDEVLSALATGAIGELSTVGLAALQSVVSGVQTGNVSGQVSEALNVVGQQVGVSQTVSGGGSVNASAEVSAQTQTQTKVSGQTQASSQTTVSGESKTTAQAEVSGSAGSTAEVSGTTTASGSATVSTKASGLGSATIKQNLQTIGEHLDKNPGLVANAKVRGEISQALSQGNTSNLSPEAKSSLNGVIKNLSQGGAGQPTGVTAAAAAVQNQAAAPSSGSSPSTAGAGTANVNSDSSAQAGQSSSAATQPPAESAPSFGEESSAQSGESEEPGQESGAAPASGPLPGSNKEKEAGEKAPEKGEEKKAGSEKSSTAPLASAKKEPGAADLKKEGDSAKGKAQEPEGLEKLKENDAKLRGAGLVPGGDKNLPNQSDKKKPGEGEKIAPARNAAPGNAGSVDGISPAGNSKDSGTGSGEEKSDEAGEKKPGDESGSSGSPSGDSSNDSGQTEEKKNKSKDGSGDGKDEDNKDDDNDGQDDDKDEDTGNAPKQGKDTKAEKEKLIKEAADLINPYLNGLLTDAAIWVWALAVPSIGTSVLLGAIVGDFLWAFKKALIRRAINNVLISKIIVGKEYDADEISEHIKFSGGVKANIAAMNAVVIGLILSVIVLLGIVLYAGCTYPLGQTFSSATNYKLSVIGGLGYSDVCKALNQSFIGGTLSSLTSSGGYQASNNVPGSLTGTAQWTSQINASAQKYSIDACILRVVVQKESGGNANAIGCDCAANKNAAACPDKRKTYSSDYQFNWGECSYGIGLTQWTIFPKGNSGYMTWQPADVPSRNVENSYHTVQDFLDPNISLDLTAHVFSDNLAKHNGDLPSAFGDYVGASNVQSQLVADRIALYNLCKASGTSQFGGGDSGGGGTSGNY